MPRHHRPVSYYALFQGWLLLSQPPGCLCTATPLPTEPGLRDLSRRSGLFPSRPRVLAPVVSLPHHPPSIRRLVRVGKLDAPAPIQHATSRVAFSSLRTGARRHLNAFRGEPAISAFDRHFTTTHSSSLRFAIQTGSGLHARVPPASPWPWVAHAVSGRLPATCRPFGLAFAPAPGVPPLTSRQTVTRRLILQKARRHPIEINLGGSDRLGAHGFRLCFTPLAGVLFTVPSRYWFALGRSAYLALGRGRPRFPPDFACPAVLTLQDHDAHPTVAYGTLTRSGRPFQHRSADGVVLSRGVGRPLYPARPTPHEHPRPGYSLAGFGLLPFRSPLLRESSLFLRVLRCFSSPRAPRHGSTPRGAPVSPGAGCPIRIPLDRPVPAGPQGVSPRGRVLLRHRAP